MNRRNNNKGYIAGWEYIVFFFVLGLLTLALGGIFDFFMVEFYEPLGGLVLNETLDAVGNDTNSDIYLLALESDQDTKNTSLPFNILYIFVSVFLIGSSIISVIKSPKRGMYRVLIDTIGGVIFLIYMMQLTIFKLIEYIRIEFLNVIFDDLILKYVPFYQVTLDYWVLIILFWGLGLIILNRFFGAESSEGGNI